MALTENERFIFSVFYLKNCCDTSCLFFPFIVLNIMQYGSKISSVYGTILILLFTEGS
jgi:hypothetical protein